VLALTAWIAVVPLVSAAAAAIGTALATARHSASSVFRILVISNLPFIVKAIGIVSMPLSWRLMPLCREDYGMVRAASRWVNAKDAQACPRLGTGPRGIFAACDKH
jgi:hypothetical protein